MTPGIIVNKFSCLYIDTEVRGTIVGIDPRNNGTLDIAPDPNYRQLILPNPSPQTIHIENAYTTPCCEHLGPADAEAAGHLPKVLGDDGQSREVKLFDRVQVRGAYERSDQQPHGNGHQHGLVHPEPS